MKTILVTNDMRFARDAYPNIDYYVTKLKQLEDTIEKIQKDRVDKTEAQSFFEDFTIIWLWEDSPWLQPMTPSMQLFKETYESKLQEYKEKSAN